MRAVRPTRRVWPWVLAPVAQALAVLAAVVQALAAVIAALVSQHR